jgi:hypothetical protein
MKIYYKIIDGKKSNPLTLEQLLSLKDLFEDDLIWSEGMDDWTPACEIEELKSFILKRPPKTVLEKRREKNAANFLKSILVYMVFSVLLGIFSSYLENNQYRSFIKETTNLYSGGGVPISDIYVRKSDGVYFTRWTVYAGGEDNEQLSYNRSHEFWFRPYKAIYSHAPLSNEERKSNLILFSNFVFSSIASNVFLIPFLFLLFQISSQKKSKQYVVTTKENNIQEVKNVIIVLVTTFFLSLLIVYIFFENKIDLYASSKTNYINANSKSNDDNSAEQINEKVVVNTENKSLETNDLQQKNFLDQIYIGTNLFHQHYDQ